MSIKSSIKTSVKAGGMSLNHNRGRIKTNVKAGGIIIHD